MGFVNYWFGRIFAFSCFCIDRANNRNLLYTCIVYSTASLGRASSLLCLADIIVCRSLYQICSISISFLVARSYEGAYTHIGVSTLGYDGKSWSLSISAIYSCLIR